MKIHDILQVLERFAAPELQEDYDNAGLITGQRGWACTGVLCTLDATPEVIEEAAARGCNLVVAHHPIVFKGLKRINGKNYIERALITAIKKDIAIYACHTNLDNVIEGVSRRMADRLGIVGGRVLAPKARPLRRLITFAPENKAGAVRDAVFAAGAGHIGNYSECSFNTVGEGTFKAEEGADPYVGEVGKRHAERETKIEIVFPFYLENQVVKALVDHHPYEEVAYDIFTMENAHLGVGAGLIGELPEPLAPEAFLQKLKEAFGLTVVRHTAGAGQPVRRVALCGGSGAFLIRAAMAAGADAYVTADVKYHEFFDAEDRMLLADIGHWESEQFTVDLLRELIAGKFPTFAVLKSSVPTNPLRYFLGQEAPGESNF
ncbi:Nif3-like dinuclear metal center hexameric protein [Flaviaesturariibacter aridisoli]|uniref:GTP cyclohydrolase 1 type 2 homolog n=1 Tax=Flaviaesturariibacter aridisoli TaxID=2545761 RepID=A0A4R4E1M6_9BACT|nr:Nif3-like dinuclear metal center hexameric protein [Flaviaesturariibacter aridisoli]TCZ68640.1 Nif3-like dinuclear metal center hexameric protein [Flaviaesturariibacter aridisoli]